MSVFGWNTCSIICLPFIYHINRYQLALEQTSLEFICWMVDFYSLCIKQSTKRLNRRHLNQDKTNNKNLNQTSVKIKNWRQNALNSNHVQAQIAFFDQRDFNNSLLTILWWRIVICENWYNSKGWVLINSGVKWQTICLLWQTYHSHNLVIEKASLIRFL